MTVKTFSANSMRDAIAMVKQSLGEDAMILSTKRLPRSGGDPYRADIFQIEAMPPEAEEEYEVPGEYQNSFKDSDSDFLQSNGWEVLKRELGSIRQMLYTVNHSELFSDLLQAHPGIFSIYAKLIRSGISEKRVQMLLAQSFSDETAMFTSQSDYTRPVFKKLLSVVNVAAPFYKNNGKSTEVIAFVGPTGAGKTTTIAKLAAKLHLEKKKKTGLISIDNYRIGAFDQLKTYSSIIGIPCIPAFTKKDLVTALNKLSNMDYILVDTAGQSHLDKKRLSELKEILNLNCDVESQLVISAATGRLDMKDVVESFKMLNPSSYTFSKIDETSRRGGIIDQIIEHNMPVSFITNGQEVPEDIIVANEKTILQLLINPDNKSKT